MRLENLNVSVIQLWYFVNAVEAGSFAAAARYLNVTQSTLSKSVQSLEKNVEIQLFHRDAAGRGLAPTEAGRFLCARWKLLLRGMEEDLLKARHYPGGSRRAIRIGVLDSHRSETYLLDAMSRFSAAFPDCDPEISRIPTDELRKKLLEGELDVAFTVLYELEYGYWPDCGARVIRECPHVACMLPTNLLARRETVTVAELADMDLAAISTLTLPTYSRMLHALFAGAGVRPNIVNHSANASSQVYRLHGDRDVFLCDRFHRDYGLPSLAYPAVENTRSGVAMVWNRDNVGPELGFFLGLFADAET